MIFLKSIYIDEEKDISLRTTKKIAKKLCKANKKEEIAIALSNKMQENSNLIEQLNNYKLCILNGRWILKFLIYDILELVVKNQNEKIEMQNVAILINRVDDVLLSQLLHIAEKVRSFKIITNEPQRYLYLEDLCEDYGIAMQITNNKSKSLSKTDIIINFDFDEEKIIRYKINPSAIIINIQTKIEANKINFEGKIINDYCIEYNKDNYQEFFNKGNFDSNILYESYIYRKDTYSNIYNQMKKDGVKVMIA